METPLKDSVTVDGKTLADCYLRRVELSANERLFLVKRQGSYAPVTWQEVHRQVLGVFRSYREMGLKAGDRVCIMSQSRPEWWIADIATLCFGAVTVPIYHSNSEEDVAYILENCEAKLIFAEDAAQCQKLGKAFAQTKRKLPLVIFSGENTAVEGVKIERFEKFAAPTDDPQLAAEFRKTALAISPSSVASVVYTSGTTGRPKGAVLPHSCFLGELRPVVQKIHLSHDDVTVTFLPFAHILGRVEALMPIIGGITLGFAESINTIPQNISEIRPTLLVSVPRIYEKIYSKIQNDVESQEGLKKNIFKWSVEVGRQVARLRSAKQPIPLWLRLKFEIADRLVFAKVRNKMGGRLRFTISGGAPLAQDLCEFFHACGIKILEGYGLTETTAAICVNLPDDYVFGTVGKPVGDSEVRIAEDGEVLVRGSVVFKEYFKNPEATRDAFPSDRWFATGDIGEITDRGFLKITDRKKELIVTSGGKKIAPQKLENLLKTCRFMSNGMVYGDKQKYITALITLNEPEMKDWAKSHGIDIGQFDQLVLNGQVQELIDAEIKQINSQLASFESIKRFKILPHDFTIETGELTPSLKVKRKVVTEKYKDYIQEMYS